MAEACLHLQGRMTQGGLLAACWEGRSHGWVCPGGMQPRVAPACCHACWIVRASSLSNHNGTCNTDPCPSPARAPRAAVLATPPATRSGRRASAAAAAAAGLHVAVAAGGVLVSSPGRLSRKASAVLPLMGCKPCSAPFSPASSSSHPLGGTAGSPAAPDGGACCGRGRCPCWLEAACRRRRGTGSSAGREGHGAEQRLARMCHKRPAVASSRQRQGRHECSTRG